MYIGVLHVCVLMYIYTYIHTYTYINTYLYYVCTPHACCQKRVPDPVEQGLQAFVSCYEVLGMEPGSSGRAVCAPND